MKHALLTFLIDDKRCGRTVVGYGAAAKGNTLLNYCGVKRDLLPFVVDASDYKRGTPWSSARPTSSKRSRRARSAPSSSGPSTSRKCSANGRRAKVRNA
jgi:hypothetical protein